MAGGLLLAMSLGSIAHALAPELVPRALPGALAWAAALLLFPRVAGMHRLQAGGMTLVGALGLGWSALQGGSPPLLQALVANEAILAMLCGVTFLRLLGRRERADEALPTGRPALLRTLAGVHLLGAVINASAIILVGDRIARRHTLSPLQAIVLSRGFSCASMWSPFFAGMGVALTYAPGAALAAVAGLGLPLALLALGSSALQLAARPEAADFRGYPLHARALALPGLLAVAVLALHALAPALSVITLVAALSIALGTLVLVLREPDLAAARLGEHIRLGLPAMASELALFLSAGVLGVGVAAGLTATGLGLPFSVFGPLQAWLLVAGMVLLSTLGLHPVVGITLSAELLAPLAPDPTLLALCYVVGWGLGVSVSPFSGLHLMLQGHFGMAAHRFVRWNAGYAAWMLLALGLMLALWGRVPGAGAAPA